MCAFKYVIFYSVTLLILWRVHGATIRRPDREAVVEYVYDIRDAPAAGSAGPNRDDLKTYQQQELIFAPGSEDELRVQPDGSAIYTTAAKARRFPRNINKVGDQIRVEENQAPNKQAESAISTFTMMEPSLNREKRADETTTTTRATLTEAVANLAVLVKSENYAENCLDCPKCLECMAAASSSVSTKKAKGKSQDTIPAVDQLHHDNLADTGNIRISKVSAPRSVGQESTKVEFQNNPATNQQSQVTSMVSDLNVSKTQTPDSSSLVSRSVPKQTTDGAKVHENISKVISAHAKQIIDTTPTHVPIVLAESIHASAKQSIEATTLRAPTVFPEVTPAQGKQVKITTLTNTSGIILKEPEATAHAKITNIEDNNKAPARSIVNENNRLANEIGSAAQLDEGIAAGGTSQFKSQGATVETGTDRMGAPAKLFKKVQLGKEDVASITTVHKSSQSKQSRTALNATDNLQLIEEGNIAPGNKGSTIPQFTDNNGQNNNTRGTNLSDGVEQEVKAPATNAEGPENDSDEESKAIKRERLAIKNSETETTVKVEVLNQGNLPSANKVVVGEEVEQANKQKRKTSVTVVQPSESKVVAQDVSPAKKSEMEEVNDPETSKDEEEGVEEDETDDNDDDEDDNSDDEDEKADSPAETAFPYHGKHLGRRRRRESPLNDGNSEGSTSFLTKAMKDDVTVFGRQKRSEVQRGKMREMYVSGQKVFVDVPLEISAGRGSSAEDGVVRRSRQTGNEYIGVSQGSGLGRFPSAFCELERDTGIMCPEVKRGIFLEQFYYDSDSNQCVHFVYNGCGGNANRFSTLWECNQFCGKRKNKQSKT